MSKMGGQQANKSVNMTLAEVGPQKSYQKREEDMKDKRDHIGCSYQIIC